MTVSLLPKDPFPQRAAPDEQALQHALADSRAHWRGIAELALELSFRTDAEGRFVMVSRGGAFGWTEAELIGSRAAALLRWPNQTGADPFNPAVPLRHQRAWLRRADGGVAAVLVSARPIGETAGGAAGGAIGAVQDISDSEQRSQRLADQLQCFRNVASINRAMRRAVLPDMVIRIGLEQLMEAVGGYGAAIVACNAPGAPGADEGPRSAAGGEALPAVLHRVGEAPPAPVAEIVALCREAGGGALPPWSRVTRGFGRTLILCAISTHFCSPVTLLLWREPGRGWTEADEALVCGVMASLGGVLEHDQVQRELALQSGVDTLTGMLSRGAFVQQVGRRLDRLDAEGLSATLMLVGLDRLDAVNQGRGYEAGDLVLRSAARLLRDAVRPTDLAGRLGGDLFALWLDGADQFAAAERAESLCKTGLTVELAEPTHLRLSIGLTSRPTRSFESIETLLEQAHAALGAIKLAGGGRWHFYNEDISA